MFSEDCVHQDDVDSERAWLIFPLYTKLEMKKESLKGRLKSCGAFTEVNHNLVLLFTRYVGLKTCGHAYLIIT